MHASSALGENLSIGSWYIYDEASAHNMVARPRWQCNGMIGWRHIFVMNEHTLHIQCIFWRLIRRSALARYLCASQAMQMVFFFLRS